MSRLVGFNVDGVIVRLGSGAVTTGGTAGELKVFGLVVPPDVERVEPVFLLLTFTGAAGESKVLILAAVSDLEVKR